MDIKGAPGESEENERTVEKSLLGFTEYIYHHQQNAGENMNIKGTSGEATEGNEEHYWKLEERQSFFF